jgi:pimeloyl-ACP methyl ester carboxylesterase
MRSSSSWAAGRHPLRPWDGGASHDAQIRFGTPGLPDAGIFEETRTVGGVATRVRFSPGSGPTLVLLPGSMLDSALLTWKRTLEHLPPRVRALVPDLPGYGRSAFPTGADCSTDYYAGWLADLAEVYGLDRFALAGSSMSAAVAATYALRHPGRLTHLVLSGAYGLAPRLPLHPAVYALAQTPGIGRLTRLLLTRVPLALRMGLHAATVSLHVSDEMVSDAQVGLSNPRALDAFARWLRLEVQPDRITTYLTPHLSSLTVPTLVVHGTRDPLIPARAAAHAAQHLPRGSLRLIEGAGHLSPRERDAEVSALLHSFLDL